MSMAGPIDNFSPAAGDSTPHIHARESLSAGSLTVSDDTPWAGVIGSRWGMADVSSESGSKLLLEGPLTEEWTDRTYRAATYPRYGGDLIDEAFGAEPEDALLNLLLIRNGSRQP